MDENNLKKIPVGEKSENDSQPELSSLNKEQVIKDETKFKLKGDSSNEVENSRSNLSVTTVGVKVQDNTNAISISTVNINSETQEENKKEEPCGVFEIPIKNDRTDDDIGTLGSEETFDMVCQTCSEKELHIEAYRYCVECEEYLCEKCVKMHLGVRLTREHTLLSKEILDKDCGMVCIDKKEQCKIHVNENIEWYCKPDNRLCCMICKATDHAGCKNVVTLSTAVETSDVTRNIQKVVREIEKAKSELKKVKEKRQLDCTVLENDKIDSLRTLRHIESDTFRKHDSLRNRLESEKEKIEGRFNKSCVNIRTEIDNYSRITENLGATANTLKKETFSNEYRFIKMKRLEEHVSTVDALLDRNNADAEVTPIGYERDEKYDKELQYLDRFGYFVDEKSVYKITDRKETKIVNRKGTKTNVSAICVIDDNMVLITDWTAKSIKLLDVGEGRIRNKLALAAYPFDICLISEERFAVTLTDIKQVQFLKTVNMRIQNDETTPIQTGGKCRGICYCQAKLLVACGGCESEHEGPGHIRIFDKDGKLLKSVTTDISGQMVVLFPWKLCAIPHKNSFVVTDTDRLLVLQISNDNYTIKLLTSINAFFGSMCLVKENHCLLAKPSFKSIDLWTEDAKYIETLLPIESLPCRPLAIAIDNSSFRLFVGMEQSDILLSFKLEENKWEKPPYSC